MREKLYTLNILIVFCLSFAFMGCGGGSGDGGGDGGGDGISYTGLTTPAEIEENNATDLAAGAFAVGQAGTVMIISEATQGYQNLTNLKLDNFRAFRVPQILGDTARSLDLSPPLHQLSLKADYSETGTEYGPCGGSVTYTITINENSGEFNGTFNFSNYCDHGVTITGKTDVAGRINLNTYDIITITFWFDNLSDGSLTMDGKISMDFSDSPIICTMNLYCKDEATGKVYWAKEYSLNIFEYFGFIEVEIFGIFYHPDYGYVTLSTPDPFIVYDGDEWPSSGILMMVGANNTKAKLMAIDETKCRIEADTDGDGVYDWDSGNLYWSDFNSFFTEVGGIIDTDTVWDLEGSPYIIVQNIQVAEGITLTISPGVSVTRSQNAGEIQLWGSIYAVGTPSSKITFDAITLILKNSNISMTIEYALFKGEAFGGWSQIYGANLSLKNSKLERGAQVYLRGGNCNVEKTIFDDSLLVIQNSDPNVIKNNVFDIYLRNLECIILDAYTANPTIEYNSFLNTEKVAVRIGTGDVDKEIIIANNFWNTINTDIIDSMIYDKNDDITISGYVNYLPILSQPHPDTPTYP